jgi:hypothetical protein
MVFAAASPQAHSTGAKVVVVLELDEVEVVDELVVVDE